MSQWSTSDFLAALAHATAGQWRGEIENQQRQQQQAQQQFEQQLGLAKLLQGQQEQQDANVRASLQYLEPDAQAGALGTLYNRPSPYAGLGNSPLMQRRPDLQALLPAPPTPRGAPGGWLGAAAGLPIPQQTPQPLGPRDFRGPGGAVLRVKGVTKEQMAARQRMATEALKALEDYAPAATSPLEQADIADLVQKIRGTDSSTVEGYQSLGEHLARAGRYVGLGRLAARKEAEDQLQSRIKGLQEWRKGERDLNDEQWFNSLPGTLKAEQSVSEALAKTGSGNPHVYLQGHEKDIADIQALRAAGENDVADMAIRALRARMQGRLSPRDEATKEAAVRKRLEGMNPLSITAELVRKEYEQAGIGYLVEGLPDEAIRFGDTALYKRLAQAKGQLAQWVNLDPTNQKLLLEEIDDLQQRLNVDIPVPDQIKGQMTPYQQQQLEESRRRRKLQEDRFKWQREKEQARETRQRAKDLAKQKKEAGGLSDSERKQLEILQNAEAKAWAEMNRQQKDLRVYMDEFDFDHPKTPEEKAYKPFIEDWRRKAKAVEEFMAHRGRDVSLGGAVGKTAPAKPPSKSGAPGAPHPRLNNQQRLDLIKILIGRGKSRVEAERIAAQYR